LLGCEPTASYRKGDFVSKKLSRLATRKYGMWSLQVSDAEPEAFDNQIHQLLSQVTEDISVWHELGARFQVDLFLGFFMTETNQGFNLSKKTLSELSVRGLVPGFDVYAPLTEEDNDTPH